LCSIPFFYHLSPVVCLQNTVINLQTQVTGLQKPEASLRVIVTGLRTPEGTLRVPAASLRTPEGSLRTPAASLRIPEGDLRKRWGVVLVCQKVLAIGQQFIFKIKFLLITILV
jgi:hypothetical protein